jgi:hypothetical protein
MSVYRAQKFFIRVPGGPEDAVYHGHGFSFLLIRHFSTAATNSGFDTVLLMDTNA